MKTYLYALSFLFLVSIFSPLTYAQSDYILPYPSYMPGSKLYPVRHAIEKIEKYWYFGNFGQFTYNLKLSDKYLVEAKTLFEYNQYLLGFRALKKSDLYFQNTKPCLIRAKSEGKDTGEKEKILENAALKHQDVLNGIKSAVPDIFYWEPEKDLPTKLHLHKAIQESVTLRNKV